MYHSLSIRLDKGGLASWDLEKAMEAWRRVGSVDGGLASSSWSSGSGGGEVVFRAVGSLGWLIAFCPVTTLPSCRPAAM